MQRMTEPAIERAVDEVERALAAGDGERASSALGALATEVDRSPDAACTWLDLLRGLPPRPEWSAAIARMLERRPEDPLLVTRACDALIRAAERVPPDELPPPGGPAEIAANAAERCLAAVARSGLGSELAGFLRVAAANAHRLARAYDRALPLLERALADEPERGGWWFNLGLLHKARRAWPEALAANQRARVLLGDDRALLWNLAISAVASGQGRLAQEAFQKLGFDAGRSDSGMPYVDGLPPLQVRAATVGSGLGPEGPVPERSVGFELLWVTPISPCHGVVSSATAREASIDYGDVVLWDGVPIGMLEVEGRPVPRFPLLCRLRAGDERRFRFVALQQAAGQVADLGRDLPDDCRLFVHREQIELLCARCASGEHLHKHAHEPPEEHRLAFGKLIVPGNADLQGFRTALDAALRRHPGVQLIAPGLLEAIGDTPAAGKAHQLWRGLARKGGAVSS